MIAKCAIVFVGVVLATVFARLFGIVTIFVTAGLLGIDNWAVIIGEYLVCLAAGAVTSFCLMRKVWPKSP